MANLPDPSHAGNRNHDDDDDDLGWLNDLDDSPAAPADDADDDDDEEFGDDSDDDDDEADADADEAEQGPAVSPTSGDVDADDQTDDCSDMFAIKIPADPALRRPEDLALIEMLALPADADDSICRAFEIAVEYDLNGDELHTTFWTWYDAKVKSTSVFDAAAYRQHLIADFWNFEKSAETKVERGSKLAITNYKVVLAMPPTEKEKVKQITVPLRMPEVLEKIRLACNGRLNRVGRTCFVEDEIHGICIFDRHAVPGIFGWLKQIRQVDLKTPANYCSKEEVVSELERTSPQFDDISSLPHEPMIAGLYYTQAAKAVVPGDGKYLQALLDRFRPATDDDRHLLQAALMTILWGGPAGKRPAFLITAPAGRGVGKSTTVDMLARPFGGSLDFATGDDIGTIKARMLAPSVAGLRVAKLDNVKTTRFSCGEWEALLTADRISGKQMYVGDAQRPNLWTWFITLNGASLSTDVAQRCVIIQLRQEQYQDDWYEVTTKLLDEHRLELIGDLMASLRAKQTKLDRHSRWTSWEREILCRLPNPNQLQELIISRQGEANVEDDEAGLVAEYFTTQVQAMCGVGSALADRYNWFVPSRTAATWLTEALGKKFDKAVAGKWLKQKIDEGKLPGLVVNESRRPARGFIWRGSKTTAEAEARELTDTSDRPIGGRFSTANGTCRSATAARRQNPANDRRARRL